MRRLRCGAACSAVEPYLRSTLLFSSLPAPHSSFAMKSFRSSHLNIVVWCVCSCCSLLLLLLLLLLCCFKMLRARAHRIFKFIGGKRREKKGSAGTRGTGAAIRGKSAATRVDRAVTRGGGAATREESAARRREITARRRESTARRGQKAPRHGEKTP